MTDADILDIVAKALMLAAKLGGPVLVGVLVVGLVVSLVQAIFQVPDQSITFVPKIIAAALIVAITGAWMLDSTASYVTDLWTTIPQLVKG